MQAMDAVDNWLDIQNVNLLENSASLSGPLVYRQSNEYRQINIINNPNTNIDRAPVISSIAVTP